MCMPPLSTSDNDINSLLKMDLVTLDEVLKTAYLAIFPLICGVYVLVYSSCKEQFWILPSSSTWGSKLSSLVEDKVLASYYTFARHSLFHNYSRLGRSLIQNFRR